MTSPPRDYIHALRDDQDSTTILSTLQEIASHESVSGVGVRCLELLDDEDEEIRSWSAECLSGSVHPLDQETLGLIEFVRRVIKRSRTNPSHEIHTRLADQLYWAVTLIGRLSVDGQTDPASLRLVFDEVIESVEPIAADDQETYGEAIRRAERLRQRLVERSFGPL
ncbi:hypothetical protein [Neorhodopirellula pilleata]|uniref:HEAT repeat domain-containing protein n=1 Tax=Neorhodopirellula pilleata TaxID=2714738 RepID=A0A5C6AX46_9BACT|nr:hypothetical protein [Neorhodopirellula pilleata]TWU03729.1 hypothetical protein Pla100_06590 [Neorhodopirellula pilleata]